MAADGAIKQTFTVFFSPWFSGVEKQIFSGMFYDQNVIIRNGSQIRSQDNAWSKSFSEMDGVKINDVKRNRTMPFFVFYIAKPI